MRQINILISHDQLPSGLVAQLVEQTVICSGGRGFEPHRGQRSFLFPRIMGLFPFEGYRSEGFIWDIY